MSRLDRCKRQAIPEPKELAYRRLGSGSLSADEMQRESVCWGDGQNTQRDEIEKPRPPIAKTVIGDGASFRKKAVRMRAVKVPVMPRGVEHMVHSAQAPRGPAAQHLAVWLGPDVTYSLCNFDGSALQLATVHSRPARGSIARSIPSIVAARRVAAQDHRRCDRRWDTR